MSAAIGHIADRETGRDTLARARARAALIPDLLVEANRVANNVFTGWHGRRKRGVGENFWQFRPYVQGESMAAIDWRRSARDEQIYVRDKEWQAVHTIWLWVDESPSMLFRSNLAQVSKQSRALVLAFALAELLARSGERIGWLGVAKPVVSRNAAEKLAQALAIAPIQERLPPSRDLRSHSDLVVFSDFLGPSEETIEQMGALARRGVRGHLVRIIDPAEETFPYAGRVEFLDPESGERVRAGSAQSYRDGYTDLFAAHGLAIREAATRLGWSYTTHHTDRLASQALVAMHGNLGSVPAAHARVADPASTYRRV